MIFKTIKRFIYKYKLCEMISIMITTKKKQKQIWENHLFSLCLLFLYLSFLYSKCSPNFFTLNFFVFCTVLIYFFFLSYHKNNCFSHLFYPPPFTHNCESINVIYKYLWGTLYRRVLKISKMNTKLKFMKN